MNQSGDKGYFDVNDSQSKGTVIDLLIKEFNKKWSEIFVFCDRLLVNPELANLSVTTSSAKTDNTQKLRELSLEEQTNHYFTFKTDFLDYETIQSLKLKPNSTIQLMLANESGLEKAKADRIIITESPIDAISFAQMMGKSSEYNLYIATGGHPSPSQIQFINRIVQNHACEVILAMDNENTGLRFNTTIAGGIQHPLCDAQKDIFFKIDYVNSNQ